jgi:hypothetical protein
VITTVVSAGPTRFVEDAIGEQMVMQARIVAHLWRSRGRNQRE